MLPSFGENIDELVFVGSGHHRHVYVHPYDKSKCIKIVYANARLIRHRVELHREHAYYGFLSRRGISYSHIAKYHGKIWVNYQNQTQPASVFDLIRNDNGEISKTLDVEICQEEIGIDELAGALHELYVYLLRYKVISGLKLENIVVQRTNAPPKCVMIDNIGNPDFIPICDYVDWLATRKIKRRWQKFLKKLLRENPDNPVIKETSRMVCS